MNNISLNNKTILVTGAAGFIGANLVKRLLKDTTQSTIIGIDNLNNYYDVKLKYERLEMLQADPRFVFMKGDISDKATVDTIFSRYNPAVVVN
ncbi:MAG: GDP-mannose 4,6-dehydratase, partial [Bacteroidaceae bacterium]